MCVSIIGFIIWTFPFQFFTTKPLPCDPSSLPKYPPSKEIDAKLRDEEERRYALLDIVSIVAKTTKILVRIPYFKSIVPHIKKIKKSIISHINLRKMILKFYYA